MTTHSASDSLLTCRMDSLSRALRAALKIAGKKELAYVRLSRLGEERLAISAVSQKATFYTTMHAHFIHWEEDRDHVIDITKPVAASLASFEIKMPSDLATEPLVSLRIGEEALRLRDETGLFPIARGRNEYREPDPVLPGNHREALERTSAWPDTAFSIPSDELVTAASVAKALDRPMQVMRRLQRDHAVRWYLAGPAWQLSMSTTPEAVSTTDDSPTESDQPDAQPLLDKPETTIVKIKAPEFAPA